MTRSFVIKLSAAVATSALLVAGCGSGQQEGGSGSDPTLPNTQATETKEPGTGATVSARPVDAGDPVLDAGHITKGGKGTTVTGTGRTAVTFTKDDDVVLAGVVSCSDCTKYSSISATGMSLVLWDLDGSFDESSWIATHEQYNKTLGISLEYPSVNVEIKGNWELTLMDWNSLPVRSGELSGYGPQAFRVDPAGSVIEVTNTPDPENPRDWLNTHAWDAEGTILGHSMKSEGGTEVYERPGLRMVYIAANGEWTATIR